ncbi:MAG TPA: hypothetical protein DD435_02890 [Cyanobacteria bacterium UBA8530]|nr:hypothetical protein [Cyanobacteria bacterium UBA8530]
MVNGGKKWGQLLDFLVGAGAKVAMSPPVEDRPGARRLVAEALQAFGRIDILVNADQGLPGDVPSWMPVMQMVLPYLRTGAFILNLCPEGESPRTSIRKFTLPLVRSLSEGGIRVCFIAREDLSYEPLLAILKSEPSLYWTRAAY